MRVFNNYFKIVKSHKTSLIIYVVVFLVMSILFSSFDSPAQQSYATVKPNITIVDESNSTLSQGFSTYLGEIGVIKEIGPDQIEDALFNDEVSLIITLPKDFEETLLVKTKSRAADMNAVLIKQSMDAYLNTYSVYQQLDYSVSEALTQTKQDINERFDLEFISNQDESQEDMAITLYFNYLHYVLLAVVILMVTLIMNTYKKKMIDYRHRASSLNPKTLYSQLTLGHIILGIGVWALFMIVFFVLYRTRFSNPAIPYLMLNSIIFLISCITLAVFISTLIKNENSISVVTNVYALGTSFIAGAFVPVYLLPDFTQKLSMLFPSYYYIRNNHLLMNDPNLSAMLPNVLIILGFSALFILLTQLVNRRRV